MFSATELMILALVPTRSSRLIPGFRAIPAVTIQTSAPAMSSYLFVPITPPSKPSTGPACERSSAFPWGKPSITSKRTTSPNPLSKARWAIDPPILPAPINAIFFLAITSPSLVHVGNYSVAKTGTAYEFRAVHQPFEIIGYRLVSDRSLESFDDEIGGFLPAHVTQHHLARKNDRAGIDLVEIGIFRGGAVGRFKDGVAAVVIDVLPRPDADATYLRGQRIGQIIAVQVHRGDHVVVLRSDEDKL